MNDTCYQDDLRLTSLVCSTCITVNSQIHPLVIRVPPLPSFLYSSNLVLPTLWLTKSTSPPPIRAILMCSQFTRVVIEFPWTIYARGLKVENSCDFFRSLCSSFLHSFPQYLLFLSSSALSFPIASFLPEQPLIYQKISYVLIAKLCRILIFARVARDSQKQEDMFFLLHG